MIPGGFLRSRGMTTKLQWTKMASSSDEKCWIADHNGERFVIRALSYRGGYTFSRYTAWRWEILVGTEGCQGEILRKSGSQSSSGFRTLAAQVQGYLEGTVEMERLPRW